MSCEKAEFPRATAAWAVLIFFDSEACCRNHFEMDYGEDPEEGAKVGLFQVELEDPAPQYRDMSVWRPGLCEAMSQRQDVGRDSARQRRYFWGGQTESPMWEILSAPARVVKSWNFRG